LKQLKRLYRLSQEEMKRQEVRKKLIAADAEVFFFEESSFVIKLNLLHDSQLLKVLDIFRKMTAAKQKKRPLSKKEKEQIQKTYSHAWTTRERFDDLVPDIIYPLGLDYEEKQEYAFQQYYKQTYGETKN
jgi:hypothetical protein